MPDATVRSILAQSSDGSLETARIQLTLFFVGLAKIHKPVNGEAYPEDRNRYCTTCMSSDGGSSRWPCATVRLVRKYLDSNL